MSQDKTYPLYQQTALDEFLARLDQLRERYASVGGWLEIATAAHRLKITTERAVNLILLLTCFAFQDHRIVYELH